MKTEFICQLGKLYLLSGIPGSGKSSWAKSLPESMVVSTDKLREVLLGARNVGPVKDLYQSANDKVFSIAKQIVNTRLGEKLTTFVDATLTTDSDRAEFAKLAQAAGVEVEVLIFQPGVDVCKTRNNNRAAKVPESVIDRMALKFEDTSAFAFRLVPQDSAPKLVPRELPSTAIDVIGDVHGLYDELQPLLTVLGYNLESGTPVHPQGRKLLFLGDVVDRGPKSIETLQFARRAVAAGHFMVAGNHERKLVQYWESLQAGKPQARSPSSAETAMNFMKLPMAEREQLVSFIQNLPGYYTVTAQGEQFAFVHACMSHFDPASTLHSECLYGSVGLRESGESDPDALYAANFASGFNEYVLIRGHIPQTSPQESVISLEHKQAFGGHLAALRLEDFIAQRRVVGTQTALKSCSVFWKCDFDFAEHGQKFKLQFDLQALIKKKLVVAQTDLESGMAIYKYSKQVFFDALWNESPRLLKARGIVLDLAGNIVVHPFDKVFNYGENGTGKDLSDNTEVLWVEKLNGFLGCISKHPFKNELLLTTSGSFESDFVQYIRDCLTPSMRGRLLKFFSKNDMTLMFEVLHPDDPHIIEYSKPDMGLWLIGARGKAQSAPLESEQNLDAIGVELELRRPGWGRSTFGQVKANVAASKLEGFMVRHAQTQETLLKFKTPYYLVTKFLGRLSEKKIRAMYAYPKGFKQTLDEEFYDLVDHLVATSTESDFLAMSDDQRVDHVRKAIQVIF